MPTASFSYNLKQLPRRIPSERDEKAAIQVLLIEDNNSDVFLVTRMLQEEAGRNKFEMCHTPSLAIALEWLDTKSFDVILLDLGLIDIDGVSSVAALHIEAPHIPIIVYSASYDPQMQRQALMCGASGYLIKGNESATSLQLIIHEILLKTQHPNH